MGEKIIKFPRRDTGVKSGLESSVLDQPVNSLGKTIDSKTIAEISNYSFNEAFEKLFRVLNFIRENPELQTKANEDKKILELLIDRLIILFMDTKELFETNKTLEIPLELQLFIIATAIKLLLEDQTVRNDISLKKTKYTNLNKTLLYIVRLLHKNNVNDIQKPHTLNALKPFLPLIIEYYSIETEYENYLKNEELTQRYPSAARFNDANTPVYINLIKKMYERQKNLLTQFNSTYKQENNNPILKKVYFELTGNLTRLNSGIQPTKEVIDKYEIASAQNEERQNLQDGCTTLVMLTILGGLSLAVLPYLYQFFTYAQEYLRR